MTPSFSSKNGIRYRFHVSTALRGRKHEAGSIARISAPGIENTVEGAVRNHLKEHDDLSSEALANRIERVVLSNDSIRIWFVKGQDGADSSTVTIEVLRDSSKKSGVEVFSTTSRESDPKLLQAIVRSHAWLGDLTSGRHSSIEALAMP